MEEDLLLSFCDRELYREEKLNLVRAGLTGAKPELRERWKSFRGEERRKLVRWRVRKSRVVGDDPYSESGVWFHSKFKVTLMHSRDGISLEYAKLTWLLQGRKNSSPRIEVLELESVEFKCRAPGAPKKSRTRCLRVTDCAELFQELNKLFDVHPIFEQNEGNALWLREHFVGHASLCFWHKCDGLGKLRWSCMVQSIEPSLTEQCAAEIAGVNRAVWDLRSAYSWLPTELIELLCVCSTRCPNDAILKLGR